MVTGQSVVLWSRLHLIVSGERGRLILRYTKWMTIIDAIVLHLSTETGRLMHQLILMFILILIMGVALLSIECASPLLLETIRKGFTYALKLKLEFAILGRLVYFVRGGHQNNSVVVVPARPMTFIGTRDKEVASLSSGNKEVEDISTFVDLGKVTTDLSHAYSNSNRSDMQIEGEILA
jgi:hypothetical protein